MNYRSYADLSRIIVQRIAAIPRDIDLVVAIPRSGYLAAGIIALTLNRKLIDLAGFLEGREPQNGDSRDPFTGGNCQHALIVDDSVLSGRSLQKIKARVSEADIHCRISYAAVFVTHQSRSFVDYFFDVCPFPRQFEWNVFHHEHLSRCCVLLDGIFGKPIEGAPYESMRPHIVPTYPVRHIVATRRGQNREQTEAWLKMHRITYERLTLIDSVSDLVLGVGTLARRKASIYARDYHARLFIEEDPSQADDIARFAGKPVLCTRTQTMHRPPPFLVATLAAQSIHTSRALAKRMWGFFS